MAEIRAVYTSKRLVQIDSVSIPYDYLVLATGATHSYFGRDEWAEVAPGLKRIEDATRIRRRSSSPSSARSCHRRGRTPAPLHLRDRRRRPYRGRDSRRHFRGRAPEPGDGFPPHRSSRVGPSKLLQPRAHLIEEARASRPSHAWVPGKEKKRIAVDALSLQAVVTLLLAPGVVAAPLFQRMSPGLHGECGPAILPHERRGPENSLPVPQIRALFLRLPAVRRKDGEIILTEGATLPTRPRISVTAGRGAFN
jgi:hypothetical protein